MPVSPEFRQIDLYEDPSKNWRRSFYEVFTRQLKQCMQERERGKAFAWRVGGNTYEPLHMDESEIVDMVREHARRTVEASINRHNESQKRSKERRGLAQ